MKTNNSTFDKREEWVLGFLAIYISLMAVPALLGYL